MITPALVIAILMQASTSRQAAHVQTLPTAQHTPKTAASSELDQLYANAKRFANSLSRITCIENIRSEQNSVTGGLVIRPVHRRMDTVGEFTVVRSESGVAGFKDSRIIRIQDGRPVDPHKNVVLPFNLSDAFAPAVVTYLAPEHRPCLNYHFTPTRIDFETVRGKGDIGACADVAPQAKGYVDFDSGTHTVSHFERTVPLEAGRKGGFAPFASVDYQSYGMSGSLYMIPKKIIGTRTERGINFYFEGTYSKCRLFKSKVTIRDPQGNEIK